MALRVWSLEALYVLDVRDVSDDGRGVGVVTFVKGTSGNPGGRPKDLKRHRCVCGHSKNSRARWCWDCRWYLARPARGLLTVEDVDIALQEHWAWLHERGLLAA